jgi:hypothetical protein
MKKILIPLIAIILFSCDTENLNPSSPNSDLLTYEIPEFENTQEISDKVQSLRNNISTGRVESSFVSFEDKYQEALATLETAETEDEFFSALKTYSEYIVLEDSTITPVISNATYRLISSPEGYYLSEGFVHKVIDNDHIVYSAPEFLDELINIENISEVQSENLTVAKYSGSSQTFSNGRHESSCPNMIEGQARKDERGCKKDRRVRARVEVDWLISGNYYTPMAIFTVIAERKRSGMCWWQYYSDTSIEWKNGLVDIDYRINGGGSIQNVQYGLSNGSTSGSLYQETRFYTYLTGLYYDGGQQILEMNSGHFEASSRGVGNVWAIADCN